MKALIVDDDPTARMLLRRVLSRLSVDAVEACDGLEGLAMVESEDPDLVVLDLSMPVMGGEVTLRAIRGNEKSQRLPVVCVSASRDPDAVREAVQLGISDFLLKPVRSETAHERFKKVLRVSAGWREGRARTDPGRAAVLLVDRDPNFRAFATPLLEVRLAVTEAQSGAEAVQQYRNALAKPSLVLIEEKLNALGGEKVAELIRISADDAGVAPPKILLLAEHVEEAPQAMFDGVVRRTFVPKVFKRSFDDAAEGGLNGCGQLMQCIKGELGKDLRSATMQTLGVMTQQEVLVVDEMEHGPLVREVVATARLTGPLHGADLRLALLSSVADVERLAACVLRREIGFDDGAGEAFGELVSTIGARIRASLAEKKFAVTQGTPEVRRDAEGISQPDWQIVFRTSGGERFVLEAQGIETHIEDEAASEPATPGGHSAEEDGA